MGAPGSVPGGGASQPSRAPLVSVVIPAFNGERYLAEAIESAAAQTYEPVEIVVVDDGSTDRSAAIAQSFDEVRVVAKENGGVASARNEGVLRSRGDLLAFADQDDLMTPRRLEVQVARLLANADAGVCVAPEQEFLFEEGADLPDWDRFAAPGLFEGLPEGTTLIKSITVVARRTVFEEVGPFDTELSGADEIDWMLRVREAGFEIEEVDERLVTRRIHRANHSQDAEAARRALVGLFAARMRRRRAAGVSPDRRLGRSR